MSGKFFLFTVNGKTYTGKEELRYHLGVSMRKLNSLIAANSTSFTWKGVKVEFSLQRRHVSKRTYIPFGKSRNSTGTVPKGRPEHLTLELLPTTKSEYRLKDDTIIYLHHCDGRLFKTSSL